MTCCGGALAFSEPEKNQKQIKDIIESAYDGAEMIVTPCPLCQANQFDPNGPDLPSMAIVKRFGPSVPFKSLLNVINHTHRFGLDIDSQ